MRSPWLRLAVYGLLALGCRDNPGDPILEPPTLESLEPAVANRGTRVRVLLRGTNFVPGGGGNTTLAAAGSGVTVDSLTVYSQHLITADFVVDATAATGDREVTVTTAIGTSNAMAFTVRLASPTLTAVVPSVGAQGTTVAVTLTGTDFVAGGTTLAVSGTGITVSGVTVSSSTTLTANFVIDAGAAIGNRTVSVTTVSGTSGTRTFTVNPQPPTVTTVSPSVGVQGTTVAVTLTGTNFITGATTVAVSGSDVTVSNVSVTSATSLTADFAVGSSAALGGRDVTVTTAGGTSATQTFTVNPPAVTLSGISPAAGVQGTTVAVTLTGTNFVTGGTTVAVSGSNVTVSGVSVASATSLTADFAIGSSAALGTRTVTVTTAGGTSGTQSFTVNPPAPTLTAISPTTGVQGTTVFPTLTGTNFVAGASVAVDGGGVNVTVNRVLNSTEIEATFEITETAALGSRDVTVTTSGGTTAVTTFTVNPPAPTLTAVSPTTGVQGNTVAVTLTGTNFVAGATVAVSGSNVTVSNVTVVSATSVTADFAIASGAALGDRNVTVTTAGGTTGASTFTVNPPAPTLTTVSPVTGVQGTTVSVTLTGTNFISGATTVAVSGSNITVSNVSVSSGTSLTADFVVGSSAALGDRNVTVTTAGGTTAARTFTVNPPTPTLTSVSPNSGVQGNTVSVTLTGTNFVAGATVAVSGSNVTVTDVSVVSATSITANFVIATTAAAGARTVTVTTSGGTSGTQTFTINASADPQEVPVQPSRLPLTPR
ncbi:MAG: IPT/TIG domain-containing protein [Patescibacteria group bacterium]